MGKLPSYGKTKRVQGSDDPIWLFEEYVVSHKVDGTNARLCWNGEELKYGSRNRLVTEDDDNYGFAKWAKENIDQGLFKEHFDGVSPVVVFGEFFSANIQKRVAYPEEPQFVVFDIFINSKYLDWGDVCDVAEKLDLQVVRHQLRGKDFVEMLEDRLKSDTEVVDPYAVEEANRDNKLSEGIVVRPTTELVEPYGDSYGSRLIRKIKSKKFEEINKKSESKNNNSSPQFPKEEVEKVMKYVTKNRIFSVLEEFKEDDPAVKFDRQLTGDIIKSTFKDMKKESEEDLNEKVMKKKAGNEIANLYFEMLDEGYLP